MLADPYLMTAFRWDELSVIGQRGNSGKNPGSDLSSWDLWVELSRKGEIVNSGLNLKFWEPDKNKCLVFFFFSPPPPAVDWIMELKKLEPEGPGVVGCAFN